MKYYTKEVKRMPLTIKVCMLLCATLIAGIALPSQAQGLLGTLHRGDSILTSRYRQSNIDTLYITRPQTKWTLTGRYNVSGATIRVEGIQADKPFRSEVYADYKSTLSLGVNYLGMALSLSLNPAKMAGKYNDYELNLNSYRNRWGFDFIYQNASNFTGWYQDEGTPRIELPPDVLKLKTLNVNAYYAFNYRRFSYPAAFSQSYIQRRSAGSFLLALSAQGQRTETKADYESLLKVTNIAIGCGYGYNWVPRRHWLFHISALPTFIVYSNTSFIVNEESVPLDYHFPEVIITSRGAIIRQFGNMFAGITMVFNFINIGDQKQLAIHNNKWRARAIFGFRL